MVQDSLTGALITPINSGKPQQLVTVWGDDLGPDPLDSDTTYAGMPHAIPVTIHVYLGGVEQTDVRYAGASTYPGVHIVVFAIASGTPNGCFIPLVIVTGSGTPVTSNTPVVSINDNGDVCKDPITGLDGSQINTFTGQTSVRTGSLVLGEITTLGQGGAQTNGFVMAPAAAPAGSTTSDFVSANFEIVPGASYVGSASFSIGCVVVESVPGASTPFFGLNPGPITVTGLTSGPLTLAAAPTLPGQYLATLPQGAIPATGGSLTFSAPGGGTGSNAISGFSAQANVAPTEFAWTNPTGSFTRGNGLTFTWSSARPGTIVTFGVTSSGGTATCIAPPGAEQDTIPAYVLNTLNPGTGTVFITNISEQESPIPTDRVSLDFNYFKQIYSFELGAVVE